MDTATRRTWMTTGRLARGGRGPGRTMVLAAAIALLIGAAALRTAEANQSGASVDAGTLHVLVCQSGGGTAEVTIDRSASMVYVIGVVCRGGLWDGMWCLTDPSGSKCGSGARPARPEEGPEVTPTDGIETVPAATRQTPATADETEEPAGPAEDPAAEVPATGGVAPAGPAVEPTTDEAAVTDEVAAPAEAVDGPAAEAPAVGDDGEASAAD